MGLTDVQLAAGAVEGLFVLVFLPFDGLTAVEFGFGALDRSDVVGAALAGPLPGDGRAGADPDRRGVEGVAVGPDPDVDGDLALAGYVLERAPVVVRVREVVLDVLWGPRSEERRVGKECRL